MLYADKGDGCVMQRVPFSIAYLMFAVLFPVSRLSLRRDISEVHFWNGVRWPALE